MYSDNHKHLIRLESTQLQGLQQAITEQKPLLAALLVAKQFCPQLSVTHYLAQVQTLVEQSHQGLQSWMSAEQKFRHLHQQFYRALAFSGDESDHFASKYCLLDQVLDYRTGIPVSLSVVFCHIAAKAGLAVSGVNFPGHFLLRFVKKDVEQVSFYDPLDGKCLSETHLLNLYQSMLGDAGEDGLPEEIMSQATTQEIVIRLLHNLKAAFMREKAYQQALLASELLVHFCPEDPYERRDRGLLLHQLDCPQVAMADYQYFIRHCPQDPAAQLLKLQIRHLHSHPPVVLH